jgi:GNAT superfamily N-acetyltransferase
MPPGEPRRATVRDLVAIAPLFDAYREFFAGDHDLAESERFLAERFAKDDAVVFVAGSDGDAEGFVTLYPLWSSWHCRRIWFLSDLYVKESSRRRGVGRRLVERAIAYARETCAASIMVELPRREPHLKNFYAGLGFREDALFELARHSLGEGDSRKETLGSQRPAS